MNLLHVKPNEPIQPAIDCAAAGGGGTVVLLPGVHSTGTIYLKSNIELRIPAGAVLQGGSREEDYDALPAAFGDSRPEKSPRALIAAAGAENISVTGRGVIDGSGPAFYDTNVPEGTWFYQKPPRERPRLIQFACCRNVLLEGTHYRDAAGWSIWLIECEEVNIRSLRITGDPRMINNDGIHFWGGRALSVSDCFISTGDDALVVRAGRAWRDMERPCVVRDVVVTNCILESSCQGIRIGCPCDETVRDCRFSNLVIRSRNVGIFFDNPARYAKGEWTASPGDPHAVTNISFDHISIETMTKPIAIQVEEGVCTGSIDHIAFNNITIVNAAQPLNFCGAEGAELGEIRLTNITGQIHNAELLRQKYVRRLILDNFDVERV